MVMEIRWDEESWDKMTQLAIENDAVPRCQAIADACNVALEEHGHPTHKEANLPGYRVDTEGGKPLERHDYRATVITATNEAMIDCAENNTLLYNMTAGMGSNVGGGTSE